MDNKTKFLMGKMLGLLGSDHDGEVVAVQDSESELAEMAESILRNRILMKPHERDFVADIQARAKSWRQFRMTEKQSRWFSYLYAKYGDAEA